MTVREYFSPESLPEALDLLALHGSELLVIAGGTVAVPLINDGISLPELVMSLRHAQLDAYRAARRRDRDRGNHDADRARRSTPRRDAE